MFWLDAWITVVIIGFLGVIVPGPNLMLTIKNSIVYNKRAGIYTSLGFGVGDLIHVTYSILGIGLVISKSMILFSILKWAGAAYLLYLGFKAIKAGKSPSEIEHEFKSQNELATSNWKCFFSGLWTCLLNPKITLFYLSFFTQIIEPHTSLSSKVLYGITLAFIDFGWFSAVSLLMTHATVRHKYSKIAPIIQKLTGVIFIALGLRMVFVKTSN